MAKKARTTALVSALLAGLLVLAACSSNSKGGTNTGGTSAPSSGASPTSTKVEKASITVTYGTDSPSAVPLWLAVDEGIFSKLGLTVHAELATSNVGALAVVSGGADVFFGEAATSFQAVASGDPIEIIGNLRILNDFKFYVQPSITSASDLKGKAIAISAVGDGTDVSTRTALSELGQSVDGITLLPTGTSASRLAALLSGKVAGTLLTEPAATQAKEAGKKLLLDQTKEPFTGSSMTITKAFGEKNPNTVNAFLEGMVLAVKYLQDPANKQTVLNEIAKYTKSTATAKATVLGYNTYSVKGALVMDPTPNVPAAQAILTGLKSQDPSRFGKLTFDQVFTLQFTQRLKDDGFLQSTWGSDLTEPAASPSSS
jgi:NitT/TauT family transport system substrate-binding protein